MKKKKDSTKTNPLESNQPEKIIEKRKKRQKLNSGIFKPPINEANINESTSSTITGTSTVTNSSTANSKAQLSQNITPSVATTSSGSTNAADAITVLCSNEKQSGTSKKKSDSKPSSVSKGSSNVDDDDLKYLAELQERVNNAEDTEKKPDITQISEKLQWRNSFKSQPSDQQLKATIERLERDLIERNDAFQQLLKKARQMETDNAKKDKTFTNSEKILSEKIRNLESQIVQSNKLYQNRYVALEEEKKELGQKLLVLNEELKSTIGSKHNAPEEERQTLLKEKQHSDEKQYLQKLNEEKTKSIEREANTYETIRE